MKLAPVWMLAALLALSSEARAEELIPAGGGAPVLVSSDDGRGLFYPLGTSGTVAFQVEGPATLSLEVVQRLPNEGTAPSQGSVSVLGDGTRILTIQLGRRGVGGGTILDQVGGSPSSADRAQVKVPAGSHRMEIAASGLPYPLLVRVHQSGGSASQAAAAPEPAPEPAPVQVRPPPPVEPSPEVRAPDAVAAKPESPGGRSSAKEPTPAATSAPPTTPAPVATPSPEPEPIQQAQPRVSTPAAPTAGTPAPQEFDPWGVGATSAADEPAAAPAPEPAGAPAPEPAGAPAPEPADATPSEPADAPEDTPGATPAPSGEDPWSSASPSATEATPAASPAIEVEELDPPTALVESDEAADGVAEAPADPGSPWSAPDPAGLASEATEAAVDSEGELATGSRPPVFLGAGLGIGGAGMSDKVVVQVGLDLRVPVTKLWSVAGGLSRYTLTVDRILELPAGPGPNSELSEVAADWSTRVVPLAVLAMVHLPGVETVRPHAGLGPSLSFASRYEDGDRTARTATLGLAGELGLDVPLWGGVAIPAFAFDLAAGPLGVPTSDGGELRESLASARIDLSYLYRF